MTEQSSLRHIEDSRVSNRTVIKEIYGRLESIRHLWSVVGFEQCIVSLDSFVKTSDTRSETVLIY